jgi:hypothetical protein
MKKPSPRAIAAYIGLAFVTTGALMLIPWSAHTLLVIGGVILFATFVSLFDDHPIR